MKMNKRLLQVYFIPIFVAFLFLLFAYYLNEIHLLDTQFIYIDIIAALGCSFLLYYRNTLSWFLSEEGAYEQVADFYLKIKEKNELQFKEPENYIAEFKRQKIYLIFLLNVIIFTFLIYWDFRNYKISLFLIVILVFCILALVNSLKQSPVILKIANEGLWFDDMGFIPWKYIDENEIIISEHTNKGKTVTKHSLIIYFMEDVYPQKLISLEEIVDGEQIKPMIDKIRPIQ